MKMLMAVVVVVSLCLFLPMTVVDVADAVPLSIVTIPPSVIGDLQGLQEDIEDDDDSTTHLEHLSSAATCLVAGIEYTHGQQIYRADQCEFCLCLDGEMFCWWQDCPPVVEGPCRDRQPFSPCANDGSKFLKKPTAKAIPSTLQPIAAITNSQSTGIVTNQQQNITAASATLNVSTNSVNVSEITTTTTTTTTTVKSSTTEEPFCIVMGEKYSVGASLPHDTGNCIECICSSPGPIISCSPHHPCAPPDDQQPDYRPPGPRLGAPDF